MRTTLFVIPHERFGLPVFGVGWLLIAWLVICAVTLALLVRRQGWNADTASYLPLQILIAALIVFLMPRLEVVSENGIPQGLPIRGFGIMMALATVSAVGLGLYRARKMGLDPDALMALAMWMFVPGLLGARLFFVVQYWDEFVRPTIQETLLAFLNFTSGGLVMYGSVLVSLPFGIYYLLRHKLPVLAIADIIAPSMVVGLALGRIGCFMNGCCYGGECDGPLGLTFPEGSPPHARHHELGRLYGLKLASDDQGVIIQQVDAGSAAAAAGVKPGQHVATIRGEPVKNKADAWELLAKSGRSFSLSTKEGAAYAIEARPWPVRSLPVHPTQLYAALDAAILAAFLWFYYPFRRRDGEVFALLVTLHPISRFLLEIIRDDEPGLWGTPLTIAQWTSAAIFIGAGVLWWCLARQPRGSDLPHKVSVSRGGGALAAA
ncbi:MAG TPA: prolipoprotein diacylglyceryl transferase family protein [Pirellulaceae bacterium]|nr:prolipoprotein diacylglyceryl transferase family protein [Pirellulaceae bacterium]